MIIREAAVENFTNIPSAISSGANRIELNDNLAVGGTTVSYGVLKESISYASDKQIPVVAMIRPRGGNFVYHDTELKIMEADLFEAQKLGIDAVAFGVLTIDGQIDTEAMEMLIGASEGMEIVFHMAFDQIAEADQEESINWLVDHGVSRILTHGGPLTTPIDKTIPHLKEIINWAGSKIQILPGGGINYDNYQKIASELGVNQVHGTQIVPLKK